MIYKLLIATTLSLGLGTAVAVAQNDMLEPNAAPGTGAETGLPMGWDGAIGDAFFADPTTGTLRTEDEVRANWQGLTDEQQAQVRAHCATVDTAGTQTDDQMTTGSVTPDDTMHTASIERVCDWVDTM